MEEEVLDKGHGMFLFLLVNRDGNMYFVYLNQGYKWQLLEIGGRGRRRMFMLQKMSRKVLVLYLFFKK